MIGVVLGLFAFQRKHVFTMVGMYLSKYVFQQQSMTVWQFQKAY